MAKQTKTLTLLFLRRDSDVLLAMKLRGFGAGRWNGVGGKVEYGESVEEALVREAREEISVTPTRFEKVADLLFDEYFKGEPTLMYVHVYVADKWEGEPAASEEMSPKWFDIADVPYDDMWPDDPYWLPKVLAGEKVKAEFILDENDSVTSVIMKQFDSTL